MSRGSLDLRMPVTQVLAHSLVAPLAFEILLVGLVAGFPNFTHIVTFSRGTENGQPRSSEFWVVLLACGS